MRRGRGGSALPYPLGGIGPRRGWLFGAARFVGPGDGYSDFMAGCGPGFVSDYHYRRAAEFLGAAVAPPVPPDRARRSLALTGGVDALGAWSLDRVSVSRMPARTARRGGAHVVLLDASGRELHREPLAVHADSLGAGWAVRVPMFDDRARYVVVRARGGRVLLQERIESAAGAGASR